MTVRDVAQQIIAFQQMFPGATPFQVEFAQPWHFDEATQRRIPFADDIGIYLYTQPATPNWNLLIHDNVSAVWYIGKSDAALAGRVWAHVTLIYEPGSRQVPSPRFKYEQWAQNQKISSAIREAVADGQITVYTIKITPAGRAPGWPGVIEKYLLSYFYRATGALPPLNDTI